MRKRSNFTEYWVSKNWIAVTMGLHPYTIHHYAVKARVRFFKFNGVRYIELEDTKCLADYLLKLNKISQENYSRFLNRLSQYFD